MWDSARLERVLDNLLSNAVKYSPDGGLITVSIARERGSGGLSPSPTPDSHAPAPSSWATVAVRDPGIGIPAADLPHTFHLFHRAGNVGQIAGTGIGLAGVKQIVEQHGGAVTVESGEGDGSAFTVRLPLA